MCKRLLEDGSARLLEDGAFRLLEQCPPETGGNWDTSDPLFYDWWRKRAQQEREKLAAINAHVGAKAKPAKPLLREETIAAIEVAASIEEVQSLDVLNHELDMLTAAIDEYRRFIEDEEEAALLLLIP